MNWPDDFPDEAQRGKTKTVRVQLMDVKRKALPPLDDAFAQEVGEFESLDALKAAVREDLAKHATRDADAEVRQKLMDDIVVGEPLRRAAELGARPREAPTATCTRSRRRRRRSSPASSGRWRSGRCGATW